MTQGAIAFEKVTWSLDWKYHLFLVYQHTTCLTVSPQRFMVWYAKICANTMSIHASLASSMASAVNQ